MRLPADATLIVVGAGDAGRLLRDSSGENVANLIAAWSREGLPVVHLRVDGEPEAASGTGAPLAPGELAVVAGAAGGFAGTGLEALLDDAGATTLVLCGALGALEATARDAANLGYHVFIPFDACWPAAPFADPAFSRLGCDGAAVVDTPATLAAAATAKSRQRREAQRKG